MLGGGGDGLGGGGEGGGGPDGGCSGGAGGGGDGGQVIATLNSPVALLNPSTTRM